MKIAVILGSTRTHRLGERITKWVIKQAPLYPQTDFSFLDLKTYDLPFFNEDEGPRGNKNRKPEESVTRWLYDIQAADGYIFITPEYNEGPSAALKNAIDFLGYEADRKPAVIIGYSDGANGGMYAPIQLRVNIGEVGMVALKAQQIILSTQTALGEDGTPNPDQKESLERRFKKMFEELLWYADALKVAREKNNTLGK